jgi:TFIIF-interacting CTD phosphatase-like protein
MDKLKCIVLDIDETLLCTQKMPYELSNFILKNEKDEKFNPLIDRFYKISIDTSDNPTPIIMNGVFRPHLPEFLNFCKENFELVIIWSAGSQEYVESIVKLFKQKFMFEPHFFMTKNDLVFIDDGFYKELEKIIADRIFLKNIISLNNMIVLDDNEMTFDLNYDNAIHIPQYNPSISFESLLKDDDCLLLTMKFLSDPAVKYCQDIRKINKKIFEKNEHRTI